MLTLRGFVPRRYVAPARDTVLFTMTGISADTGKSHAPPPPAGAGLAQGGTNGPEPEILPALNKKIRIRKISEEKRFFPVSLT